MDKGISSKVLSVGPVYNPPRGGIAQVVSTYSNIYPVFNYVETNLGGSSFIKIVSFLFSIFKLLYLCVFKNIKVVHIHGASNNSFKRKRVHILLAKLLRKKVIYHIHGGAFQDFYRDNIHAVRATLIKADVIVALSGFWKLFFEDEVGHSCVCVVENVISKPTRRKYFKDELIHFLFMGDLTFSKGVFDLLEVVGEIANDLKGRVKVHVCGKGEVSKVKQSIRDLEIEDIVVFEGWVSGNEKNHLLNTADVYILPSYKEGVPISILEAMSYGLPIVATAVGGIPEIVIDGDNGLLIKPGDKKSLGKAIMKMIDDEDYRLRAGESSCCKVQPYFPENVSDKLEKLYRDLVREA